MKKLILSISPDMYNQYAGLQAHFDFLAVAVATFNFKSVADNKADEAMFNIASSSDLLLMDKKDDDNYEIIHKYHKVTLGTITRINIPEWIKVKDRLPTLEDGEKVLLYREVNEAQKAIAMSIHDSQRVKYCDEDTLWQLLPETPKK